MAQLTFAFPFPKALINPSFLMAFKRISDYLQKRDVELLIIETGSDDNVERDLTIEHLVQVVDGVILSGSPKTINPQVYNQTPLKPDRIDPNPNNYKFVSQLVNKARCKGLPILGICAGSWAVNIASNGSLKQEIKPDEHKVVHDKDPRSGDVIHAVTVKSKTMLFDIVRSNSMRVNSWHDQAIDSLGKGLIVCATAPDGIIEAVEGEFEPFLLGIQFHPEYLKSETDNNNSNDFLSKTEIDAQLNIFDTMILVAKQFANKRKLNSFWNKELAWESKQQFVVLHREYTSMIVEETKLDFKNY